MLERKILEPVCRARGVQEIAQDQRVGLEPVQREAVALEQDRVELEVVADLSRSAGSASTGPSAAATTLERDVADVGPRAWWPIGTYRAWRSAVENAIPTIGARIAAGSPGITRSADASRRLQLRRERRQLEGGHEAIVPVARLRRRRVLSDERSEAEPREQLERALPRRPAVAHRVDAERDGHVRPDARELPALPAQIPDAPGAARGNVFEECRRRARAAPRASRTAAMRSRAPFSPMPGTPLMLSIVSPMSARTSTTCSGATPNFSFTASASNQAPSSLRVEHFDAVADELEEVLVSGDDRDLEPRGRRLLGQRADHIVRLVPLGCEDRHAERFACVVNERDLLRQILGHRPAVRFVVGGEVVAERAAGQVEGGGDELGLMLLQQLAEHRDEDVDGVGRPALRIPERSAFGRTDGRVERPVHLR